MSRTVVKTVGIVGTLVLGLTFVLSMLDEPLRRYAEREFNRRVDGYSVAIGRLDFHPLGLAVDFENVRLVQNKHPDPPVAHIPRWHASIHWRALLHGYLVSDHRVERPTIHITRTQMKAEARDDVALTNRGWQAALLAVYPFKINLFAVTGADVTYLDNPRSKPLHVGALNVRATNIRNVETKERTYPSSIHVDGQVFGSGHVAIDGAANFLSEPHPGMNVEIIVKQVELADLLPITGRANVQLREGVLSTRGRLEYSPVIKQALLSDLMVERLRADYVHSARTNEAEKDRAARTAKAAGELSNHPEWLLRIDHAKILDSEIGFVNEATNPTYRVYFTDANVGFDNFSNQLSEGTAYLKMTGKFMGSGLTQVSGTFRPERNAPDFDLHVRLVNTRMRSLNDVLRAYGDVDVVGGAFSFFTELTVKNGRIDGYVKPFFKEVDVFDVEQDRDKALAQKLYEGIIGGAMTVLENRPRDEVATHAHVSGPVTKPEISTWEVIVKLIQNAFFKAILPGLARDTKP